MGGMSSSGQGNPLGNSLVSIGTRFGGVAPTAPNTGASYTQLKQINTLLRFQANKQMCSQSVSPFVAQLRSQQANPLEQFGLQTMLHSAIQSEMPQAGLPALASYRSSALDYRPNMSGITANLQHVVPSVELQQRLDAEAAARRQVEEAM